MRLVPSARLPAGEPAPPASEASPLVGRDVDVSTVETREQVVHVVGWPCLTINGELDVVENTLKDEQAEAARQSTKVKESPHRVGKPQAEAVTAAPRCPRGVSDRG